MRRSGPATALHWQLQGLLLLTWGPDCCPACPDAPLAAYGVWLPGVLAWRAQHESTRWRSGSVRIRALQALLLMLAGLRRVRDSGCFGWRDAPASLPGWCWCCMPCCCTHLARSVRRAWGAAEVFGVVSIRPRSATWVSC